MTALPLRDFSDAERAKLDAIEAAPAAAESVREVVAAALWEGQEWYNVCPWSEVGAQSRANFLHLADAALAVLSGPSSDAERAVERCENCGEDAAAHRCPTPDGAPAGWHRQTFTPTDGGQPPC